MEVEGERKWVAAPSYPDAHRCTPDYFFEVGKGGVRGGGEGEDGRIAGLPRQSAAASLCRAGQRAVTANAGAGRRRRPRVGGQGGTLAGAGGERQRQQKKKEDKSSGRHARSHRR